MNIDKLRKYLKGIEKNNKREWFHENKEEYDNLRKDFRNFVQEIILGISEFDKSILGVEPETCIFRLNRDVRFSNDKTPYKTFFSAAISSSGKKGNLGMYYLSIGAKDEDAFLGGGMWRPEKDILQRIRNKISEEYIELEEIILDRKFGETFGELDGDKLVRPPQGYDASHPAINYLKLKSFTFGKTLTDGELSKKNLAENMVKDFKTLYPFIIFLRHAARNE